MTQAPDILCVGSVLWDMIGRSPKAMRLGSDQPGRIIRLPGGVAMNIAMTLVRFGMRPGLLSVVGQDRTGDTLLAEVRALGINTDYLYRSEDLPTDSYMAIEGANGLIAAIADAHSLEQAGGKILRPLEDGRLGSVGAPWRGPVALDGNLTEELLRSIAGSDLFAAADLRVAPASPGKAERLRAFLGHPRATFYVNLEEAALICAHDFEDAAAAACALRELGVARALVTDGGRMAAEAAGDELRTVQPPPVMVTRVTGAGDTFMAAHIASEVQGANPGMALARALDAAASYVSGEGPR